MSFNVHDTYNMVGTTWWVYVYRRRLTPLRSCVHNAKKSWQLQSGVVLCEVLVTVGVVDGLSYITDSQVLTVSLTVLVVLVATVDVEVRGFMDKSPGLGIGTGVGGAPEGTTEVDLSELVGI